MEKLIRFNLNGKETEITIDPTLTLLRLGAVLSGSLGLFTAMAG